MDYDNLHLQKKMDSLIPELFMNLGFAACSHAFSILKVHGYTISFSQRDLHIIWLLLSHYTPI